MSDALKPLDVAAFLENVPNHGFRWARSVQASGS